jgi:hypothetical protein
VPFEPRPLNEDMLSLPLNATTERAGLDYKSK